MFTLVFILYNLSKFKKPEYWSKVNPNLPLIGIGFFILDVFIIYFIGYLLVK